jgi:sodium-dependent dicarboxylate transporter 2/3/5
MSSQSASQSASFNIKYYIHSLIVIILMFGFPMLPTIDPLTDLGMHVAGIFLGCLYGWTFVGIIWPSMLGLLALGFTEFGTMQETFAKAFGGDTYLFVFFMLAFAALISQAGVTDYIAKWVISRKVAAGKPYVIAGLVYAAAFVVGALVSVMPSIVICWALTYQLCAEFGYTNKDLYPKLMVIGVVNAALMGQCAFPFKPFAVMMRNVLVTQMGYDIDFGRFTLFVVVLGIGSILIWMGLCKFVYKPDVTSIEKSQFVYTNDEHLTTYQKQVLGLLGLLILAMFLPGFLPACGLKTFLTTMGNTGLVLATLMICAFVLMKDGKSFADITALIRTGVPWPTMFLLATAMTIASAIGGETGIAALFKQLLGPVFIGHGIFLFYILMITITIILTNIINNVVVGLIMVPIVCTFSTDLGFSPIILTAAICLICNITFLLPSGSPIAAFLHGNSEWVTTLEVQKYSILLVVLDILWTCIICMTLGNLLW